jgi:uncharacterized protein
MVVFWIILLVLLSFFIPFLFMMKGFKNPERKHEHTPDESGIDFKEVIIKTKHNCNLYGWWIVKKTDYPTIILVHGWGRNVERMMPYIRNLNKEKFNLLAIDARNHGNSDKDKHSTMKKFAEDISSSVDFVYENTGLNQPVIGVIGLSVGGSASIYASAHDSRIQSIVTVGAFANPLEIMKLQLKQRHVPYVPLGWMLLQLMQLIIGLSFNQIAPEKHIRNSQADILLIHGTDDKTVPLSHAERLLAESNKEKVSLWKLNGKGHSNCHEQKDYWDKIAGFLNKTLTMSNQ